MNHLIPEDYILLPDRLIPQYDTLTEETKKKFKTIVYLSRSKFEKSSFAVFDTYEFYDDSKTYDNQYFEVNNGVCTKTFYYVLYHITTYDSKPILFVATQEYLPKLLRDNMQNQCQCNYCAYIPKWYHFLDLFRPNQNDSCCIGIGLPSQLVINRTRIKTLEFLKPITTRKLV